ncbi:MAG: putative chitinase [Rhodospirillaceae bacterium]|nr:MAG: putative chitinase [Rhodospirillaceae bacterium]
MLSEQTLRKMLPAAGARLDAHLPFIAPAMIKGDIKTPDRIAAFLAHLAHESGEYRYMAEIWGPTEAQLGYEGRGDLGNTQPGDGRKFAGHGPIQVTGRANHRACGQALGLDLESDPTLITRPEHGTASAVWFWTVGNGKIDLNLLADRGWFKTITRVINGGLNGLSDRRQYWDRNRALLGLPMIDLDLEAEKITAFQRARGLTADGVAGPKTFAALRAAAA